MPHSCASLSFTGLCFQRLSELPIQVSYGCHRSISLQLSICTRSAFLSRLWAPPLRLLQVLIPPTDWTPTTESAIARSLLHQMSNVPLPISSSPSLSTTGTGPAAAVPVVTLIPQGWSPDHQHTNDIPPTAFLPCTHTKPLHSGVSAFTFLPKPCTRLRWHRVNPWYGGSINIYRILWACLRWQETKLWYHGSTNIRITTFARLRWQEIKLWQTVPLCLHDFLNSTFTG